jgi:hypothetical protein
MFSLIIVNAKIMIPQFMITIYSIHTFNFFSPDIGPPHVTMTFATETWLLHRTTLDKIEHLSN